jgi:hypothetical protein
LGVGCLGVHPSQSSYVVQPHLTGFWLTSHSALSGVQPKAIVCQAGNSVQDAIYMIHAFCTVLIVVLHPFSLEPGEIGLRANTCPEQ